MVIRESVPLRSLTTLNVGGPARYVIECDSIESLTEAVRFARAQNLPFRPLGQGSNVLADDAGYNGVVLHIRIPGISITEEGEQVRVEVGAGVAWDALIDVVALQGLWGLENLAGIPGTVGAAPVQNIGAYGAEVKDTLYSVRVFDPGTEVVTIYTNDECAFGYRDSRFKREQHLIITGVTFMLSRNGAPRISYPDLEASRAAGVALHTPIDIARAVRSVRSNKFPDLKTHGTAGSFFKNPILTEETFAALDAQYPGIPRYPVAGGIKIPLAWILDHVLALRSFTLGPVLLFERQPLVLVTTANATAHDVEVLAQHVTTLVFDATNILIEREVQKFL